MIETTNLKLQKYELTDAANLADGYNNSMDIIDSAIQQQSEKISDYFPVETNNIGNGQVTENKLSTAAVTETKIANGAVTEDKLSTAAVTETKIANGVVTEDKLSTAAVTETKIANGVVTEDKLEESLAIKINSDSKKNIMLAFGDSFGVDTISQGPVWPVIASAKLGAQELHNYCVGGAAFNKAKENNFFVQVNKAITEIKEKDSVKYIGIVGGTNDSTNSITNAIIELVNLLSTNFVNATIGICINCNVPDLLNPTMKQIRSSAVNLNGTLNKKCYIDSLAYIMLQDGCFMSDKTHPTTKGSNLIGTQMACVLSGAPGATITGYATLSSYFNDTSLRSCRGTIENRMLSYVMTAQVTPNSNIVVSDSYPYDNFASIACIGSTYDVEGYVTGQSGHIRLTSNSTYSGVIYFGITIPIV